MKKKLKDIDIQLFIGSILRWGVISSMIVVFFGGIIYIYRHHREIPNYHLFKSEPEFLKKLPGIFGGILNFKSRAIIQFGILLLIATPIVRVLFSVFSFLLERDYLYVVITLIVFGILLFSMFSGIGG